MTGRRGRPTAATERPWFTLITAEHGGHEVPPGYRHLFAGHRGLLRSHSGWDPGTLDLARRLADLLDAPLVASSVTRLLVDLNRSPTHPRVFSEITRPLPEPERRALLQGHHRPHRETVEKIVAEALAEGARVLHLATHSFTPVLAGVERRPDLALLYDPARELERTVAAQWVSALRVAAPARTIRRNDPYRGKADGLTTTLRRLHPGDAYLGIEIEVNQKHLRNGRFPNWVGRSLVESLHRVLGGADGGV